MRGRTAAAITAVVFVGAIAAVALAVAQGNLDTLADLLRAAPYPPALVAGALSVLYVVLAALIAARRARGPSRGAAAVGWLLTLPGLFAFFALVAEGLAIDAAVGCNAGARLSAGVRCPDTIAGQVVEASQVLALLAAFTLPFSAGPLLFAILFPVAMILLGIVRLWRRGARATLVLGLAVIVLAAGFLHAGGGAALREPRPFDVVMTAIGLELSGPEAREIPQAMDEPSRWLLRARGAPAEHDSLTRDFAARGWALVEQLGSLRIYAKGGLRTRVICRMVGARYQLCEAEGRP